MKRYILIILCIASFITTGFAQLQTVPETTNYTQTSLYKDVMNFLYQAQKLSPQVKILTMATSTEGRMIPLVVLSKENIMQPRDMKMYNKEAVLIMANIHAGEIEGKEACQMLIRDIIQNKIPGVLDNQVILFIPIYNVDGNDKLGKNRRDNGPELAGIRPNGQNLDLNRDYIKLESPEARGLIKVLNMWDPVLFVDMHTTDGSLHREPLTYTPGVNPNGDKALIDYMWQKFFPSVMNTVKKKYGYESIPYGNFIDRLEPEKGWTNDAFEGRYGNNYVGLRNRFSILDENYSYADFKTRVLASYSFVRTILEYTNNNIIQMSKLVRASDIKTAGNYSDESFVLEFKPEKLSEITIKSYVFVKEKVKEEDRAKYPPWIGEYIAKKTDELKDYTIPYMGTAVPVRTTKLPVGYIILPYQDEVIENLQRHGIVLEKILEPFHASVENFKITRIETEKTIYQGHVLNKVEGAYETKEIDIPANSYFVSMHQPLARLIALLLEPDHIDSLLAWDFFNRVIVEQWSDKPSLYPVYRIYSAISVPGIHTSQ